jgi:hypothetical protein
VGKKTEKRRKNKDGRIADLERAPKAVTVRADHPFERLLAELSGRFDKVLSEMQREGAASVNALASLLTDSRTAVRTEIGELTACNQRAIDLERRARERFEEIDARGRDSFARMDRMEESVAAVRDQSASQIDVALRRALAEAMDRLNASQRVVDHQAQEFGEQVTRRLAEVMGAVEEELRDLREFARLRIENTVTSIEALSQEPPTSAISDTEAHPAETGVGADGTISPVEPIIWEPQPSTGGGNRVRPDDGFFGRLAAELREDPDRGQFPTSENGHFPRPTTTPVATVTAPPEPVSTERTVELMSEATPRALRRAGAEITGGRPVNVAVPRAALKASTQMLARSAADQRVRIEVVHVAAHERSASCLRLTVWSVGGWWEYHDVPAEADCFEPCSAVLDLGELIQGLEFVQQHDGGAEAHLHLDGDVTIGNVLLLDRPSSEPVLSYDRKRVERVDLDAADRAGLVLETQLGRLFIPPRLVSLLQTRNAFRTELVTVADQPCLSAQIRGPSTGTEATIVAQLSEDGTEDGVVAEERRSAAGSEVAQLIRSLSATTTPDELEQILKVGVGYARRRAAAHPALPVGTIHNLIQEGTEAIRAAAASNRSVSTDASVLAAADPSTLVRAAAAANPATPGRCLEQLASDGVAQVRARAASNAAITAELLEALADDPDSSVRAVVAAQPHIDPEALVVLAQDPDPMVCAAVADNPSCPAEVLNELVELVPDAVLANPSAPKALLAAGSRVYARNLRAAVAANPATPAPQLHTLARDEDVDVLRAVAENPSTPGSARRRAQRRLQTNSESAMAL